MLPYQIKALGCELPPASLQLLEGLCTEVTVWSSRREYMACAALTKQRPSGRFSVVQVWADHGDAIAQQVRYSNNFYDRVSLGARSNTIPFCGRAVRR